MAVRFQQRRVKDWRMPKGSQCVSRPSRFANPFDRRELPGGRAEAAQLRREALLAGLLRCTVADVRRELLGLNLGCFCRPGEPCHADTLFEIANMPPREVQP